MSARKLFLVLLFISPFLGLYLNGFSAALLLGTATTLAIYTMRRRASQERELVYLFVVLNQLMFMYCWYYAEGQIVLSTPDSHLHVPARAEEHAEPFVSIVLVDGMHNSSVPEYYQKTVDSLLETASPVLTREIIVSSSNSSLTGSKIPVVPRLSDGSEFIIFVSGKATFTADWMVGIVRELFVHRHRLVIPTLYLTKDIPLTGGAMISSERGQWFLTDPRELDRELPLIPIVTAVGVRRETLDKVGLERFTQLLYENKLLEISLLAWFCLDGIENTSYSKIVLRDSGSIPDHDWKAVEGELVDESVIASCNSNRSMDWFYEKFAKYDLDAKLKNFQVQIGTRKQDGSRKCLVANYDGTLGAQICEQANRNMLFFVLPGSGQNIRPVGFRTMCLDANSANLPGSKPILYTCTEHNRNQMFYLDVPDKIRWGSFCLAENDAGGIVLDFCNDDIDNQIFHPEYS